MKKTRSIGLLLLCLIALTVRAEGALELYGIIDMGIQYAHSQQTIQNVFQSGTFLGVASGVEGGSRIGLRGSSDLGGGTMLRFMLENGFNPSNGTAQQEGRLFGRQSTMGIANAELGQIDFGRQINLARRYFMRVDPFSEVFGQASLGTSFSSVNSLRFSNMLLVQSRSLGGLTLGAGYSFATTLSSIYADNGSCTASGCVISSNPYQYSADNNLRALTLGLTYQQGPLLVSAAFDSLSGPANIPNGPPSPNPTAWLLGGVYDLNLIKLSAAYGQTRNGSIVGQDSGTGATSGTLLSNSSLGAGVLFASNVAYDSYMLGLTVPIDRTSLFFSWQMAQPTGPFVSSTTANQTIFSAGYLYNFTKRTNLYAYVSYANNFAMVSSAQSAVMGVGLRHQF
jgi:predicted porin